MPRSYYDVLKVSSTASVDEIEDAYAAVYNQWRRLVTHHDPAKANQASRALQILEHIRATLTDPAKRAAYDGTLNQNNGLGGLADPSAQVRAIKHPLTPPPFPHQSASQASVIGGRIDSWICPTCQAASPVGTRFCKACGHTLGCDCPHCGNLTEAASDFCTECGVNVEQFAREKVTLEQARRRQEQEEAARRAALEPIAQKSQAAFRWSVAGSVLFFLSVVMSLIFLF